MDSGQTKEQVLAEAQSYRIIDASTESIRLNLLYYKKEISMTLVIVCIF